MTMDADTVLNPARVRKNAGSVSRIDHSFNTEKFLRDLVHAEHLFYFFLIVISDCKDLIFSPHNNIGTETYLSLFQSLSDCLVSGLLLSLCTLSDSSFFSDDLLFCRGETG